MKFYLTTRGQDGKYYLRKNSETDLKFRAHSILHIVIPVEKEKSSHSTVEYGRTVFFYMGAPYHKREPDKNGPV